MQVNDVLVAQLLEKGHFSVHSTLQTGRAVERDFLHCEWRVICALHRSEHLACDTSPQLLANLVPLLHIMCLHSIKTAIILLEKSIIWKQMKAP